MISSGAETSMAFNSPLHHKILQFERGKNEAIKIIQESINEYAQTFNKNNRSKLKG